jgi:hypothetical protein
MSFPKLDLSRSGPRLPAGHVMRAAPPINPTHGAGPVLHSLLLDLTVARDLAPLEGIAGNLLWAEWASAASALIVVRFNSEEEGESYVTRGWNVAGKPFDKILVAWEAQPGVEMNLRWANDTAGTVKIY